MMGMGDDPYRTWAGAYAVGALDGEERADFERHMTSGCADCEAELEAHRSVAASLAHALPGPKPALTLRDQVLDLSFAPSLPLDLDAHEWQEVVPGVRLWVHREDPARNMRACLIWATPGARHPLHRHLGDENILVLQGGIKDERADYRVGEICRSRAGSIHSEEALPGEDCLCYVVYYGDLEMIET